VGPFGARLAGSLSLAWLVAGSVAVAAPVSVRTPEGSAYAVLVLRSQQGAVLAGGELVQTVKGNRVQSRLTFHFRDGSLHDETVTFTQRAVFVLESYRVSQKGPAFPRTQDVHFERSTGRYSARIQEKGADSTPALSDRLELPDDVYNGMASILIRNLPPGGRGTARMVAFTPKPRLVTMGLVPEGEDTYVVGTASRRARRYLVDLELPGLIGVLATVTGKQPPALHYWLSAGPVPGFLKFEGPFYLQGPVWRIEVAGPQWKTP
jgi:hypothetical protein